MIITRTLLAISIAGFFFAGYFTATAVDDFVSGQPPPLTLADKAHAPRTKYTDDIDSFVTYDMPRKDRSAALLGAQRAVSWMERHGEIEYFPPSEGDSP